MKLIKSLGLPLILAFILAVSGCSSSKKDESPMDNGDQISSTEENSSSENLGSEGLNLEVNADSDSGKAGSLQTISFAFDSATLSSAAKRKLEQNASFLKANPSVEVQIEGHADERGGVQYNLALGEKRAQTVKNYLVAMGVNARRISTISFGKERPIAFGHDEIAWGRNRRANFVVTSI